MRYKEKHFIGKTRRRSARNAAAFRQNPRRICEKGKTEQRQRLKVIKNEMRRTANNVYLRD